jgi:hypothetical protein
MPTTMDSSQLNTPIDALYLMHKALRAEADRVEEAVSQLEMGGSFKPLHRSFYRWAMALGYYVESTDHYLTPLVLHRAQDQEAGHRHVMEMLEDLQTYLHADLGRMIVIPRTQRQLRSKVIALRIVQDDLLEDEEEGVLPVLRQRLSETQQLEIMRHLLSDAEAEEGGAMLDWVAQDVTATEWQWLAHLAGRWEEKP